MDMHPSVRRVHGPALCCRIQDETQHGTPIGRPVSHCQRVDGQRIHQTTSNLRQGVHLTGSQERLDTAGYSDRTDVEFDSAADRSVDASGQVVDQSADGLRRWVFVDDRGSCYSTYLTASSVLIYRSGGECPGGRNAVRWFAHTDGSPESLGWLEAR